jgi:radical SAM/Cys-rich protein
MKSIGTDFTAMLGDRSTASTPVAVETLWVNITRRCNQSCLHCHVDASPQRTEQMDFATMEACLKALRSLDCCANLDITGGAPELHPDFEYLVAEARKMCKHVIVRHNLTVTMDGDPRSGKSKAHLPSFFAANGVELVASLPYCDKNNTDTVRGEGVFDKSIASLQHLNSYGYGQQGTGLKLDIMCNRDGAISPRDRLFLESSYRQELGNKYGITFNRLLAVTNMPINRHLRRLQQAGTLGEYTDGLVSTFEPGSASDLVCRYLVSVSYDGRLFDCDFNQMLDMPVDINEPMTIFNLDLRALLARRIRFGPHCFGCTAGGGST